MNVREVDARGNCSKCGGTHYGSLMCPMEEKMEEKMEQEEAVFGGAGFDSAILALRDGLRVRRAGWNGKGMWITLSPGNPTVPAENLWAPNNRKFAEQQHTRCVEVLPYITMKTVDNKIVPWLASQTDLLADDWEILPSGRRASGSTR